MTSLRNFLLLVRLNHWRSDKISFFFLILLYFQHVSGILGSGILFYRNFFLAGIYAVSYYSFLFLVNDYFDLKQDKKAGKSKTVTRRLGKTNAILFNLAFFTIGTVSLFYLWNR